MKVSEWAVVGGLAAYSTGLGQALAVPGTGISLITAGIFYSFKVGVSCVGNFTKGERQKHFKQLEKNATLHALNSCKAAGAFVLGGVPLVGAFLAVGILFSKKDDSIVPPPASGKT